MPEEAPPGWNILGGRQTEFVIKALAHPLDRVIYEVLAKGMLQQCQLLRVLRGCAEISESLLRFHLKRLKRAGLIDFVHEGRKKYVRRAMDIRMLARPHAEEVAKAEAPTLRKEHEERLRGIFRAPR